jgi:hypothetical protein
VLETVVVKPRYEVAGIKGYDCHSSEEHKEFGAYKDALKWATDQADKLARKNACARGAGSVNVIIDVSDNSADLPGFENMPQPEEAEPGSEDGKKSPEKNRLLLETIVTARAIGTLKWLQGK